MVAFQEKSRLSLRSYHRHKKHFSFCHLPGTWGWKLEEGKWVLPSYYISAPALEAIIQFGVWLCKEPMYIK